MCNNQAKSAILTSSFDCLLHLGFKRFGSRFPSQNFSYLCCLWLCLCFWACCAWRSWCRCWWPVGTSRNTWLGQNTRPKTEHDTCNTWCDSQSTTITQDWWATNDRQPKTLSATFNTAIVTNRNIQHTARTNPFLKRKVSRLTLHLVPSLPQLLLTCERPIVIANALSHCGKRRKQAKHVRKMWRQQGEWLYRSQKWINNDANLIKTQDFLH